MRGREAGPLGWLYRGVLFPLTNWGEKRDDLPGREEGSIEVPEISNVLAQKKEKRKEKRAEWAEGNWFKKRSLPDLLS